MDFSYLVLRPSGAPVADKTLFRVVSDRLEEKGRTRLFGCGPAGRHALVRLSRDRSAANSVWEEVSRGEVIAVEHAVATGEGLRLKANSSVSRVTPARR